ncbi:MAG: BACON domain-containing protein [bacterium]
MKQYVHYIYFYENKTGYVPEMISIFNLTHDYRGECEISLGIGETSIPDAIKRFDYYGGDNPFPPNNMVLDISEFAPFMSGGLDLFFLGIYDSGEANTGTINSFSLEVYDDYASGVPTEIYTSSVPPLNTIQGANIFASLITGENVIYLAPANLYVTENPGDSVFYLLCNSTGAQDWVASIIEGSTWLSITSGSSGSNDGIIEVHYNENTDLDNRFGRINVTATWANNSPLEATVRQTGTREGLEFIVMNYEGNPASGAFVEVYSDINGYGYEYYYDSTDAGGMLALPGVPDGEYTVVVSSTSEHFIFILEDVRAPDYLELFATDLTPVNIYTLAKDGTSTIASNIHFVPFPYNFGYIGSTDPTSGHMLAYVSDWQYTGVAAVCFDEPYHLIYFDQAISGPTNYTFDPVTMPTGDVSVSLDAFDSIWLTHFCGYCYTSWLVTVQNGDSMTYSAGTYGIWPDLIKEENGYEWTYNIQKDDLYSSFVIESGSSYILEAGGVFSASTVPDNSDYDPGEGVLIFNEISDAYENKISLISGYVNDSVAEKGLYAALSRDGEHKWIVGSLDERENLFKLDKAFEDIYPVLRIYDPDGTIVSEESSYDTYTSHAFTLSDPAVNGTYTIDLSLDTGPHQGMISGSNNFIVPRNKIYIMPSNLYVTKNAGDSAFDVMCNGIGSLEWTASVVEGDQWLSITSGSSGSDDGIIEVHYNENSDPEARVGRIRVTAAWAENSPQEATVTQISQGLALTVMNYEGEPASWASVEVYSDVSRYGDYYGYTDASGMVVLPDVPDGEYTVVVSSNNDHFIFILENVTAPDCLQLFVSDLTPVDIYTLAKDGTSPIASDIHFVPFPYNFGHIGSTDPTSGHMLAYVSNWQYTGVAAVCFDEPYHLVYENQAISGPTNYTFDPTTMLTGEVSVDLDDFNSMYLLHFCGYCYISWGVKLQNGYSMTYSVGTYSIGPHLIKEDNGYEWTYSIHKDNLYSSFMIESGSSYILEAGGVFSAFTVPEKSDYDPGETVFISNDFVDAYENHILNIYGYVSDSLADRGLYAALSPDGKHQWILSSLDKKENLFKADGADDYIYPVLRVYDPYGTIVSEGSSYITYTSHAFTLSDPAVNGTYTIDLSLDTGPHQGVISGSDNFTVKGLTVTSPNGGEAWQIGAIYHILWESGDTSGSVKIELSRDNGSTWETLFVSTVDDHIEEWEVTGPESENSLIKITDTDGAPSDQSNYVFTISYPCDLASFASAFGSVLGDSNYSLICDMDRDGDVDGTDLAAFTGSATN